MAIWTRGRRARPIAGIVALTLLVSFVLSLAPPLAHAQNIFSMLGSDVETPTTVAVLDFANRSGYSTGMLGRSFADALTIEMVNTRRFEVINRKDVDDVLTEMRIAPPFSHAVQSMVTDRLNCPYAVSGSVDDVKIHRTREGAFAEVKVQVVMVSKITRLPINGASVTLKGSPKLGYTGNTDVLVHEALNTAAYMATRMLLDNRITVGTVTSMPNAGDIRIKGGSTNGYRKGMEMTTIRRETVTGRVRLTVVDPIFSTAVVLSEANGIASGDRIVPVYEPTITTHSVKEQRVKSGIALASVGLLGVLAWLVGTDGDAKAALNPGTPQVAAVSNAAQTGLTNGGVRVSWTNNSDQVVAYVIYRSGGGDTNLPIYIVNSNEIEFIDADNMYPIGMHYELSTLEITYDSETGQISPIFPDISYEASGEFERTVDVSQDSATIACIRPRPIAGAQYSYQIQPIIKGYGNMGNEEGGGLALGKMSAFTPWVTLLAPPSLDDDPTTTIDYFSCHTSMGATDYIFQISDQSSFAANRTYVVPNLADSDNDGFVRAYVNDATLTGRFGPVPETGKQLYWRFGARVTGEPDPNSWRQDNANTAGYVFSIAKPYNLPIAPPAYESAPMRSRPAGMTPGTTLKNGTGRQRR